jgi:hypothetical protein
MPPRSDFPVFTSRSDARTAVLQGLVIAAIVVTALYVGKTCCSRSRWRFC